MPTCQGAKAAMVSKALDTTAGKPTLGNSVNTRMPAPNGLKTNAVQMTSPKRTAPAASQDKDLIDLTDDDDLASRQAAVAKKVLSTFCAVIKFDCE